MPITSHFHRIAMLNSLFSIWFCNFTHNQLFHKQVHWLQGSHSCRQGFLLQARVHSMCLYVPIKLTLLWSLNLSNNHFRSYNKNTLKINIFTSVITSIQIKRYYPEPQSVIIIWDLECHQEKKRQFIMITKCSIISLQNTHGIWKTAIPISLWTFSRICYKMPWATEKLL